MISVNGQAIEPERIYQEMQYHPAASQSQAEFNAAQALVIAEVVKQRAKALGLEVPGDDAQASEHDFTEELVSLEVPYPEATEEECQQYYEAQPHRFSSSPLLDVRHILLAADPADDQQRMTALESAEQLLVQLQAGKVRFEKLAQEYSVCSSSKEGGSLGQLEKGQTVPEFERQVFAAPEGLMPAPVETRYGYHLVEVLHRAEGQVLPYEVVKSRIADYLNTRVRRKAIAQYLTQLVAQAHIEGIDLNVSDSPMMQ